jgi:hypothetical protein
MSRRRTTEQDARNQRAAKKILVFGCLPVLALVVLLIIVGSALDNGDDKSDTKAEATPSFSAPAAPPSEPEPSPSESDDGPGISKRRMTELSVGLTWDNYSEAQKDALCSGVEAYGPEWVADQLKSDNLDHEYAGQLIEEKCQAR